MPELNYQELAKSLDIVLNGNLLGKERKIGFALLVFPFGETPKGNRINYIGNGERDDIKVALKELLARWEGRYAETETKQ